MVMVHASGRTVVLRDADLREVGVDAGTEAQAPRLARLAEAAGCHGVVACAHEVGMRRRALGPQMLRVTPGFGSPVLSKGRRRGGAPIWHLIGFVPPRPPKPAVPVPLTS